MKKTFLSLLLGSMLVCQLIGCGGKTPATNAAESETVVESESEISSEVKSEEPSEGQIEDASEAKGETTSETASETPTDSKDETPAVSDNETSADAEEDPFVGNWYEKYAQRGYMTITKDGDVYNFQVNWADSAAANYCWTFSAPVNEAGVVAYSDCTKTLTTWDDEDHDTTEVIEENASGSVYILENGNLAWDEHNDMPEPNEFIKE